MSIIIMNISPHGRRHEKYEISMLLHRGSNIKKKKKKRWPGIKTE